MERALKNLRDFDKLEFTPAMIKQHFMDEVKRELTGGSNEPVNIAKVTDFTVFCAHLVKDKLEEVDWFAVAQALKQHKTRVALLGTDRVATQEPKTTQS